MKRTFQSLIRRFRENRKSRDSVIEVCQLVRGSALGIQRALATFKEPLDERDKSAAVKVISELEGLADAAYNRITDRLIRLTGASRAVDLVESPLRVKDGADESWSPTTWTGVHAELMTYFVRSVEVCRRAVNSPGMESDEVTRHALVDVMAFFEEMLWIAERNAPQSIAEPVEIREEAPSEMTAVSMIELRSCALMSSSSIASLEVVPGILKLSSVPGSPALFVPRDDPKRNQVSLAFEIVERLIELHPERQPLFQGCTHIVELTPEEMKKLDMRIEEFIVRPLLDSDASFEERTVAKESVV